MPVEKKSKRQERREKMQQQQKRSRMVTLVLIVLGSALVVLAFVYPQFKSVGDIIVPEPRTDLLNPDGLSLGDPNAPAVIDVFEDFQCSHCKTFSENIEPLIIEYLVKTGKARLVYHNYPFLDGDGVSNGGGSDLAANASMCANEQGKFWEMKDIIYANASSGLPDNRRLTAMAEAIDLDMNTFNACFDANKYQAEIQADYDYGQELGVSGTPSAFVNKAKVENPVFQDIAVAVDAIAGQ
jgi:protein-disulfide isomerase